MQHFRIEHFDRKENRESIQDLSRNKDQPTKLNEYDLVRLCSDENPEFLDVFIGNLKLKCFEHDGHFVFSIENIPYPFFVCFFINNSGLVSIQIWNKSTLRDTFYVEITSTKITDEEKQLWFKKIQQVFPVSNVSFNFTSMSNVKVDFANKYGFYSTSSFANELYEFLSIQAKNFNRPGFLKVQFSSLTTIGNQSAMDQTKGHLWVSSNMLWKQTKPNSNSLVKQNMIAYEPIKYPSKKSVTNFNTDLNQRLLFCLKEAVSLIQRFLDDCKVIDIKRLELRSQFETSNSKLSVVSIVKKRLQQCCEVANHLVSILEDLGVKNISGIIRNDSRFGELTQNIIKFEYLLNPLRNLNATAENLLAIPSNDLLFEYFSYALVVEGVQSLGFVTSEVGEGSPIPFYMKFIRDWDGITLTVFYDQTIPKIGRSSYFHPLVDKNRSNAFKRPDFIFHIRSKEFDSSFIADAKFKTLKKCLKDNFGTKLNSEHIVGKYTSGISQLGSFGRPPFFILGICLANDVRQKTEYHSSLHDTVGLLSASSPLVQSGAMAIGYESTEQFNSFFSEAVEFHKVLARKMPKSEILEFEKPREEERGLPSNRTSKRQTEDYVQTWEHKAPSLSAIDAAEIKAMLDRGDKPQDIAFYFGVNNGRISEIKSGLKFANVLPKTQHLPPAGPYPPIRDLI